jgi:hypothetical protein
MNDRSVLLTTEDEEEQLYTQRTILIKGQTIILTKLLLELLLLQHRATHNRREQT